MTDNNDIHNYDVTTVILKREYIIIIICMHLIQAIMFIKKKNN